MNPDELYIGRVVRLRYYTDYRCSGNERGVLPPGEKVEIIGYDNGSAVVTTLDNTKRVTTQTSWLSALTPLEELAYGISRDCA